MRLRLVLLAAAAACDGRQKPDALPRLACAVECIHTYS